MALELFGQFAIAGGRLGGAVGERPLQRVGVCGQALALALAEQRQHQRQPLAQHVGHHGGGLLARRAVGRDRSAASTVALLTPRALAFSSSSFSPSPPLAAIGFCSTHGAQGGIRRALARGVGGLALQVLERVQQRVRGVLLRWEGRVGVAQAQGRGLGRADNAAALGAVAALGRFWKRSRR